MTEYAPHPGSPGLSRFIRPRQYNRIGYLSKTLGFSPSVILIKGYEESIILDTTTEVLIVYIKFGLIIYRFVVSTDTDLWFLQI